MSKSRQIIRLLQYNMIHRKYIPNQSNVGTYYAPFLVGRSNETMHNFKHFSTSTSDNAMFSVQDEEDFQEKVIKSDIPVVVDFHANWCGPCKLLGPRLETVIGGKGEKVHLAKINIDSVSDLALEYGVSAVPSVLGIKQGKVVDKFVGLQEETKIDAFVNKLIGE